MHEYDTHLVAFFTDYLNDPSYSGPYTVAEYAAAITVLKSLLTFEETEEMLKKLNMVK